MGGVVALWGASSLIASVQRGTITIGSGASSNTATIAAVNLDHSRVVYLGNDTTLDQTDSAFARVALTNSTTVTATRGLSSASDTVVSYEVVEYAPGVIKSIQRGTTAVSSATTNQAITAVQMAKTVVDDLGFTFASTSGALTVKPRMRLSTETNLEFVVSSVNGVAGWQVVEWF